MFGKGEGMRVLHGIFASPGQRAMEGRLAQLIAGRTVLADELANLDTPGFQAQGASAFAAALSARLQAQMGGSTPEPRASALGAVPAAGPLLLAGGGGATGLPVPLGAAGPGSGVVTPNGNGMDFEALMAHLAQNGLDYQAVSRQLQLAYTNLREAIDAGGA